MSSLTITISLFILSIYLSRASIYVRSSFAKRSTTKYLGPFLRISSTLSLKRRARGRDRRFLNFFGRLLGLCTIRPSRAPTCDVRLVVCHPLRCRIRNPRVNALLAGDKYLTLPEEHEKNLFFYHHRCLKVARAPHTATPAEHYAQHARAGLRAAARTTAR